MNLFELATTDAVMPYGLFDLFVERPRIHRLAGHRIGEHRELHHEPENRSSAESA